MNHKSVKIIGVVCIFLALPPLISAKTNQNIYFVEPGPIEKSTLYADGSTIELHGEIVTWPMIGSDPSKTTLQEFKKMVLASRESFENDHHKIIVSPDGPERGLNIIFNVSNPPPGAVAALESVATYLEGVFSDDITVTINVNFAALGPGILGATSSYYAGVVTYTNTRNGLIAGMDSDDSIQNWLPSGSTIPVRYDYGFPDIINEDRCFFTRANYRATIGTVSGLDASMTFSTNFSWDYDPSDGITGAAFCFETVAAHETGHALGFVSGADFRVYDIEALDLYRFQNTDDVGDYNPDNLTEFQTLARLVSKDDAGAVDDDVNSDLISLEYRMSDGTPYQCSHFKQTTVFACMQPAFGSSQTFYPHFYKNPDKLVFDAIGWDYLLSYTLTRVIVGEGTLIVNPDQFTYAPGTPVVLTANPATGWRFTGWGGSLSGEQNPDTIFMDDDKTINANFITISCTLTVNIIGNGTVLKNPDLPYYLRDSLVELTAVPDGGWTFNHWSGHLWGSHNPDTIKMNGDKTVNAHFVQVGVEEHQVDNGQMPFVEISPNPSGNIVTIRYSTGAAASGKIEIYDAAGQLLRNFPIEQQSSIKQLIWDRRDNVGIDLPNGVYFIEFILNPSADQEGYRVTKKLLFLR